jgi:transposase
MSHKTHTKLETKIAAVKIFLKEEMTAQKVAENFNVSIATFFRWLQKYRQEDNFEDLENKHGGGPEKKLNSYWAKKVFKLILKPADNYGFADGLWTTTRIVQLIEKKFNMEISRVTVWRALKESEFFYKSPEKNYNEGDPDELDKWLKETLPDILKKVKKYNGILYFLDEANIKLSAMNGKTWAPKGVRPVLKVSGKRGSISAISAITPNGYLVFNVYDGTISSQEVEEFILYMLEHHKRRHIFILMDRAKVHVSNKIKDLEKSNKRLHIEYLPPYWPKYNPDEYVWNYLKNEEMKVYSAKDKNMLMKMVVKALENISSHINTVKGIFMRCPLYHFL